MAPVKAARVRQSILVACGIALLSVLAVLASKLELEPLLLGESSFATLLMAVTVSAWYGGRTAAVLTTLAAAMLEAYFFLPPYYSFTVSSPEARIRLFVFVGEGVVISLFAGAVQAARARAERSETELRTDLAKRELLLEESEARRRTAQSLAEIGHALAQTLDPAAVAQRIADSVCTLLRAEASAVYRSAPESGDLIVLAAAGHPGRQFEPGMVIPRGTALVGIAVETRRPVMTSDVLTDPRVTLTREQMQRIEQAAYRAILAVPLIAHDQVIGALALGDRSKRQFTDEEIETARAFADEAALALQNARLYAKAEASERRYRGLFEGVPIGLFRTTPDGRFIDANSALVQMLGYRDLEAVLAARVSDHFVQHEEHALWQTLVEREEVVRDFERAFRRQDGTLIWVNTTVRAVRDGTGQVRYYEGALENVTDRKRAQEAGQRQAQFVRLLQLVAVAANEAMSVDEALLVGIRHVCTHTGWNVGHVYMVGPAAADVVSTPIWHVADPARFGAIQDATGTGGQPCERIAKRVLAAGGTPLWVSELRDDPDGRSAGAAQAAGLRAGFWFPVLVGADVAAVLEFFAADAAEIDEKLIDVMSHVGTQLGRVIERARAEAAVRKGEEQLRQSQKMEAVGRLAGGIAHDFNNLLTVITGRIQILLRSISAADPARRHLELIEKTAERAAALVKQLLAFSRKQVLATRVVDVGALVAGLAPMLQRLLGEDIELLIRAAAGSSRVKADTSQLEQIILNLAVNARDAMPRGGRLTIEVANANGEMEASRAADRVMLAISDTGVGMDEATVSRIFEPFFTTKGVGKGTGLGLATVYGIVEQHHGAITVDTAPGRGTTFRIYLPRASEDAVVAEPVPAPPPVVTRGTETILVVEDQPDVRDLVAEMLRDRGYTVLEAGNGVEALRLADSHPALDLLVSDLVMPGMSGREVAERIKATHPTIKVLFMSGYTDDEVLIKRGVLDSSQLFLHKPFTLEVLEDAVRKMLDGHSRQPRS